MTEQQPGAPQGAITEAGEAGEPCDFRCGYVSTGLDLWLHVFHEHARCPECGNEPAATARPAASSVRIHSTAPYPALLPGVNAGVSALEVIDDRHPREHH